MGRKTPQVEKLRSDTMAEYFIIGNPERGEYLDPESISLPVKLSGVSSGVIPELLIYLIMDYNADNERLGNRNISFKGYWKGTAPEIIGDETEEVLFQDLTQKGEDITLAVLCDFVKSGIVQDQEKLKFLNKLIDFEFDKLELESMKEAMNF
jgi:hypothetical protein